MSSFPRLLADILGDPIAFLYFYAVPILFNPRWQYRAFCMTEEFSEVLTKDSAVTPLASSLDLGHNIIFGIFCQTCTTVLNHEETSDRPKVRDIL